MMAIMASSLWAISLNFILFKIMDPLFTQRFIRSSRKFLKRSWSEIGPLCSEKLNWLGEILQKNPSLYKCSGGHWKYRQQAKLVDPPDRADILDISESFPFVKLACIPRTCNVIAHRLTKFNLSSNFDSIWAQKFPS